MGRKNPFTRIGRPPGVKSGQGSAKMTGSPMNKAAPMSSFDAAVPGAAFRRGGRVHGHCSMPKYHDNPAFCSGGRVK